MKKYRVLGQRGKELCKAEVKGGKKIIEVGR